MKVDWQVVWLCTGVEPAADIPGINPFLFVAPEDTARELWLELSGKVLPNFIKANPGRRPWGWWVSDAPAPRARVGGIGTPLRYTGMHCGIPTGWSTTNNRKSCMFSGAAVDPANPPVFESQAAYLRRLNLLSQAEARRLRERDFQPEPIDVAELLADAPTATTAARRQRAASRHHEVPPE